MDLTPQLTEKIDKAVLDTLKKRRRKGDDFKYKTVDGIMGGKLVVVEFTPNDWAWDEYFVLVKGDEVTKVYESSEEFSSACATWMNSDGLDRLDMLFRVFVLCFLASFAIAILGITRQIQIEPEYQKALFGAVVLQLVAAMIALFKGAKFFGTD